MIRAILIVVLVTGCKRYETRAQLDEKCERDHDCEDGLDCIEGFRKTRVCMKTCGPTVMRRNDVVDTSCPPGWQCMALSKRLKDADGNDMGSAWGGLADQPLCVPNGWSPPR